MKASVCIEMIFTEYPFLQRIERAAEAGFDAVEFWSWDNKDLPAISAAVARTGLVIAAFQANLGGTLVHPEQRDGFVVSIQKSLEKAQLLKAPNIILLTDELGDDRTVRFQFPELSTEQKYESVLGGLRVLAPMAEEAGINLLLEPLNTRVDHPGFFLNSSRLGFELVRLLKSPRVKVLYDIYHMQLMEGNLTSTLLANLPLVGHLHVADVPGRKAPGAGEINYPNLLAALARAGYAGYVGMEYYPANDKMEELSRVVEMVKKAR